jgi:hypothetical protein
MSTSDGRAESARNFDFVGHSGLAGRGDALQVMVAKGHAYVGHRISRGISVVDVRDPRAPRPVNFVPTHPNSWSIHLQTHGELMLAVEEFDFKSVIAQKDYYAASIRDMTSTQFGRRGVDFSAGMRVYDLSDPANPRPIGFLEVEGLGLHRIWWVGDRYAYASAILDGYTDHILIVIDLLDPTRPVEVGRWWMPGMWKAGGETADWSGRVALHHAVVADDIAYGSWRDGGLTVLDVSDKSKPTLIAHRNWSPPFAGGTHSALPLHDRGLLVVADEAVLNVDQEPLKHTWVFDIRERRNPVSIATFPIPAERDYHAKGGQFGPHNLHENRPGSFQSSDTIFATWQSAGLRAIDLRNPFRPEEAGHWVPAAPSTWFEPMRARKKVVHCADVYVAADGLAYLTDYDTGLNILQWKGH